MKCHAISLPIQSCLWKRAKMMKDSMNKMIKKNKRWFRYVWFFCESERKKQKKMIQKFVWKIKKSVRIHDDDFFQKRWDYLYREKKHNCFLNDCIVSVSAGGRYQPLGVWPLINEQCHAHFRDLCPAHNKMSVPPTYLPPKRISLNFCGLKKKLWKCLLHGKQSNNSEEKNNAPKFEMHLWGFFLQTIYTPLSILTNYY